MSLAMSEGTEIQVGEPARRRRTSETIPPPTLHEALSAVGWSSTTNDRCNGTRRIYNASGEFVGDMTASSTWEVLRERGLYPRPAVSR